MVRVKDGELRSAKQFRRSAHLLFLYSAFTEIVGLVYVATCECIAGQHDADA